MKTKLKNLKITKVDFVDEGANPDAHIRMIKKKDGKEQMAGEDSGKNTGFWKSLFGWIGSAAGMDQSEIDSAMDEIEKGGSISFKEKFNAVTNQKIADEIWDICYALQSSFCSILNDEDLDSARTAAAMQESLEEFHAVVQEAITQWSGGKTASIVMKMEEVSEVELEVMKSAVEKLNEVIKKTAKEPEDGSGNNENQKGEEKEMKIDKSKLTDAEKAFLESIEKRYGTDDGSVPGNEGTETVPAPAEPEVMKSVTQTAEETGSIYNGLHPAVRAELEVLKKFREETEEKELGRIAEKYTIIGKKKEELVPLFKSLKAAGGTAYSDMIAVLDQAVETVEKSGVFSEIGKSSHGSSAAGAVESRVSDIAKGYMNNDPSMNYAVALAKAWEDHPELMEEYEKEEGF